MSHIKDGLSALVAGFSLCATGLLLACSEGPSAEEGLPLEGLAGTVAPPEGSAGMGVVAMGSAGTTMQGAAGHAGGLAGMTGGAAGTAGGAADASVGAAGSDAGPGLACMTGRVTGSQLVFIGDSFIAAPTSNIAPEIEALMMAAGSTAASATPRYKQVVGATMEQIVAQYDAHHAENPDIKVVIGNGGGNDVLVTNRSCLTQAPPANASCKTTIETAVRLAKEMMEKAEAHGVEHFVYFFYPHEPEQGLFQGIAPTINDSLDYAEPLARAVCEASPICTFVSLREAVGDLPGDGYTDRGYVDLDGTHPSPKGSAFYAKVIWDRMVDRCIAQ